MQPYGFTNGFDLVFQDHFDGSALNESEWEYRLDGPGSPFRSGQQAANVSVSDSLLHIQGTKVGADYFGGGIESLDTYQYGYFEARIKISPSGGWHQTFWTNEDSFADANRMSEIDIAESHANVILTSMSRSVVTHPGPVITGGTRSGNFTTAFHVFGALHTAGLVHFYYDGESVGRLGYTANEAPPHTLFLSNISLLADTMFDGELPSDMQVDWVRAYSIVGAGPVIDTPKQRRAVAAAQSPLALCQESIVRGMGGSLLGTRGATLRGQLGRR